MSLPSVTAAVRRHAAARPRALAAADAREALDWAALLTRVEAQADTLRAAGIRPGDRVAHRLADGVAALVAALAVLDLGAVHAPVDHLLAAPEVLAAERALGAGWRLVAGADGAVHTEPTGIAAVADPLGPGQSAFVRCSSGTTGAAKGVLMSHATILARVAGANRGLHLGADDRVLWLLPMAYHFAVSVALYLQVGAAIVFGNALRAATTAAIARAHAVTFAYASPYHVRRLADLPADTSLPTSLRRVVSTTTALDADAARRFHARHGVPVAQGLGIIEVGLPLLSAGDVDEPPGRFATLPDYRVRILDATGAALPAGETGELAIAGPGLLDAYLDPWRARTQVLHDGFFRTGDIARVEPEGWVQLLGRCKDVINVGGVKVFPLEVESVLAAHPDVVACRVRGEADPRTGERVVAEVVLAAQAAPGEADARLAAWCGERLAAMKRPAAIVVVERLELTASGKVRR